jgi:hypothetical protein
MTTGMNTGHNVWNLSLRRQAVNYKPQCRPLFIDECASEKFSEFRSMFETKHSNCMMFPLLHSECMLQKEKKTYTRLKENVIILIHANRLDDYQ